MSRVIKTVSADGATSSGSTGLTTAQVNTLIEAKTGWEPIEQLELSGTVTSIDFTGYDTDVYYGFKAWFDGFYIGGSVSPYVRWNNYPSTSSGSYIRMPDGYGTASFSNTQNMYLTSQSYNSGYYFSGELTWFLGNRPHGYWESWGDSQGYWYNYSETDFYYTGGSGTNIDGLQLRSINFNISNSNNNVVQVYGLRKRV